MSEKNLKRKLELQDKLIERQSKQIESLKSQVEELKLECEKKDNLISSVDSLKDELSRNVAEIKEYKEQ